MSSQPLVSCIIPVYNAAKYLNKGIDSLLAQTYSNIEIVLVDDWSTDTSWDICQEYAKKYKNILAFRNKSNSGAPLRGRERGIKEAHGEWITFMDCDDYVGPLYVEHLVETTENGKYDIAVTGHSRVYPDGMSEDFLWKSYSQSKKERLKSFYEHYFLDQDFWTDPTDTVGQSLIRSSVAKSTDFSQYPNTVWGEDSLMALAFLANSKTGVNFVDHHDFNWRQREGSGSHGGFSTTANRTAFYKGCYSILNEQNILPAVSIIVPIFNVEQYLAECLDSIIDQTYPNLEIILVDDKSLDSSGRIADEYLGKDERITVIHKPQNEGLNKARETGYKASAADHIVFVDSDDLLTKDCVEVALRTLINTKTDFVRFGTITFKDNKSLHDKLTLLPVDKELVLKSKKELYMTQFDPGRILGDLPVVSMTVWGALYRRNLVEKIDWSETNYRIYEDNIWTMRLLENVTSAAYLSHTGYLYRYDNSFTNVLSKRLTGNTLNGEPVGYMEFWSYVFSEYRRYNKKFKIGADDVIEKVVNHLYTFRAGHLTEADLWNIENNIQFLPEVLRIYHARLSDVSQQVCEKDEHIRSITAENSAIHGQLAVLQTELRSHLSIKRSAKLTAGNIKRRLKRKA